jgi:fumarate reductase iron-sulfur subunit
MKKTQKNQPFPFRFFKFSIQRYRPPSEGELPQAPGWERYELDFEEHLTVLEALHRIKGMKDATLSYRWSCQMGICGSCGMVVNGRPVLACSTYCKDIMDKKGELRIQPMRHMPILKDLIADIDDPMDKMRSVMPYLDRIPKGTHQKPGLQSKKQRERIDQTSQCIKCMLCYSACTVYGQEKSFLGPGAGVLAYRYQVDSRDSNGQARLDQITTGEENVWGCSFIGECSAVCPKRVDPAKALQRLKVMGALNFLKKPFQRKKV